MPDYIYYNILLVKYEDTGDILVKSIGLDIVEVARIEKDIEKFGDNFIKRILSDIEYQIYLNRNDKAQFLAGRFAAKEAVIKGLGVYLTEKPSYNELQIIKSETGEPKLTLPVFLAEKLDNVNCLISITHEKKYAAAVAVFLEEK